MYRGKKIRLTILIFFFLRAVFSFSQTNQPARQLRIDSLIYSLAATKDEAAKINLRYLIGIEGNIYRNGFWDSLVKDADKYKMPRIEVMALDKLAYCLRQGGKISESVNYFNKCIVLAEERGYKQEMVSPLQHLSKVYFIQNNIKKALDYCYKGLKIAEEVKDNKKIAASYVLLGEIYYRSGELKKALTLHLRCLEICEQYNLHEELADALLGIGAEYCDLGDTSNAIHYYLQSEQYIKELGESPLTANIYNAVGAAYAMKHEPDSAALNYLKSYKISERMDDKALMTSSLVLLGWNSFMKGNNKKAKKQALQALGIVKLIGFKGQIPNLALLLKSIYQKDNNYKAALKYYELYVDANDSVVNETTKNETLEKQYEYDLEKKENANKLLAQQNQIQLLQLSKKNYLMFGLASCSILILIISFLFIRQNRIRSGQKSIQLEQKLLRSQMNPHFIFNSLQAIQNFILKQDEKRAVKYLSSFAGLIRSVLENSRMELIPVKKELLLIHEYLQLQKLRFRDCFNYNIHIDSEIDQEHTTIPPMLCQPFIENAIEHGMKGVDDGIINISYLLKDNTLLVEIIDNGYGIKARDPHGKVHQSLALDITRERIELMNKREKTKTTFEITEAFPLQEERKGVKVHFNLPLHFIA